MKALIFLFLTLSFSNISFGSPDVSVLINGETYYCSSELPQQSEWSCVSNCTERWNDTHSNAKQCRTYKKDFCGYSPTCNPVCKERWNDSHRYGGACRTYGPDSCQSN